MEELKKLLKTGLGLKALQVIVKDGQVPSYVLTDATKKNHGEPYRDGTYEALCQTLLKNKKENELGNETAELNLKGVGTVIAYNELTHSQLSLFLPPSAQLSIEKYEEQLLGHHQETEAPVSEKNDTKSSEETPPTEELAEPIPIHQNADTPAEESSAQAAPAKEKSGGALQEEIANSPEDLSYFKESDVVIRFTNNLGDVKPASDGDNPIDPILKMMMDSGASDLHLTMGEIPCIRLDGEISRLDLPRLTPSTMRDYFYPIMPMINKKEFEDISDTDFAYEVRGLARFRVNMFRDRTGVGAVLRQIPADVLTADQLGLGENIRQFAHLHKGLVVVTGPTGSGKSTTLAAIVDLINKTRTDHILTVEDPVEFVHQNQQCLINHREVGKHTKSFSRALKAALREDPDIVLIGEMRDLETVAIAIETAETGHLVFGTLHTNTAISTVDRIIDQFPADQQSQIRMMLSSSLMGVVAQNLLKKKGGGRCAAQEVLVVNDAVRSMIREGKTHMIGNHMQTKKVDGNILMNDVMIKLVEDGLVDPEHAISKTVDKKELLDRFKQKGIKCDVDLDKVG